MSLQIWLPLNKQGDFTNRGVGDMSIISNAAQYSSAGKIGGCMLGDADHRLVIGCQDWFKFNPSTKFSIALWVKGCTNGGWLLACNSWEIQFRTNTIRFYPGPIDYYPAYWNTTVDPDKWYHICGTWDGHKSCLYVDGELKYTTEIPETATFYDFLNDRRFVIPYNDTRYINDFRLYDHTLSQEEVKEISQGLVLHYKLDDTYMEPTTNIGGKSIDYSSYVEGQVYVANSWGGDEGTVQAFRSGGYNNLPYKVYHKISKEGDQTGGIYKDSSDIRDIQILSGHTYTMSIWIRASVDIPNEESYSFSINGKTSTSDNHYITYGKPVNFTTSWQRLVRTFTATDDDEGMYYERCIIYRNMDNDYDVYYSGFQIEEKDHATPFTLNTRNDSICYDSSGYNTDGTITGDLVAQNDSPRYDDCVKFNSSCIGLENLPMFSDNKISISFWMKPADTTTTSCLLNYRNAIAQDLAVFLIDSVIRLDAGGQTYFRNYYYTTEWQHVVLTYDGSYKRLYINGELTQSVANTANISIGATKGTIGISSTNTTVGNQDNIYSGELSDYRIYSTALSADDVKDLYNTSASIDNRGTLHTREIVENTENLFTLEKLLETINPDRWDPDSTDPRFNPQWVMRNGQRALAICPNPFYYNSSQDNTGLLRRSHLGKYFKPGKQYKFDFWIDVDDNYYMDNGVLKTSYAGVGLSYTDGTDIRGDIYNDLNSPKGFQHKVYYSDPTKTIQGIFIHFNSNTPGYYRSDSSITEVKDVDVQKCGIVEAPWLVDTKAITGTRSQYDTNIYEEPDGSRWVRIFHHANPSSDNLFNSTDSFSTRVYGNSDRWFDVSICNQLSSWELMIKQKLSSTDTLQKYRWKQQTNPMLATASDVSADKVIYDTSTGYTSCTYGGLFKLNSNTYLSQGDYWLGAVGCWSVYNSGIPGWNKTVISSTGYMDLYVRIDDTFQKETNIYDNKIECNSFIEN